MRVLIATEPGLDGVFRYVEALCGFLMEKGVSVHLAYSDRRASERLPQLVDRVESQGGATTNLHTGNRPDLSDFGALSSLVRLSRVIEPDLVHSHSSKAGALSRFLPYFGVSAVQLYQPHAYVGLRPGRRKWDKVYNFVERCLGRSSYTVVCSGGERSFALRRLGIPPARVFLLPHGVDREKFSPATDSEKRRIRESLGLPPAGTILGFIGRSSEQKDPCTLYQAFAQVAREKPIFLFHVGRGELDAPLEQLVHELNLEGRVFRRAYMDTPAEFYKVVDGFILTSTYEGFSLAALEALAADLPLILSEAPGNVDLLAEPLSHCWHAPPGNVEAFARCIFEWHHSMVEERPSNHRMVAAAHYDHLNRFEKVLALYQGLIRKRSAPP